jgi:outer membrane biosynthesis protein TonB
MSQATPGMKQLRIALKQGAKITEDKTLKSRVSVSVGQNETNTFVVPASQLPSTFTLFEAVANQYSLVFSAAMQGKVTVGGDERSLESLRTTGAAKPRKDVFVLPLTDASRGRVTIGDVSLLFQFVAPVPEAPKALLPPEIQGSAFAQVDRFFLTILGISLFLHFSVAGFIIAQPVAEEHEVELEELPDRFVKALMPEAKPPPKKDDTKGDEKKDDKKDDKKATTKKDDKPTTNKQDLANKVARSGLLKIIGASGAGGAFEDVLGGANGVGDVASALSGASGVAVATGDSIAANGPKGGTAGSAADIGSLGTQGGGNVGLGEKAATTVRPKVDFQPVEVDSADVDRAALTKFVNTRKSGIVACYEAELKRNPTLKGKVVVRFNITPSGRTGDVEIEENTLNNDVVASCIKTKIRGWIFPFKPDADVAVAYPFVFSPAN